MKREIFISLVGAALLLSGCGSSSSGGGAKGLAGLSGSTLMMNPLTKQIAFPNTLLMSSDGHIDMPIDPKSPEAPLLRSLNKLDGFSTTSPIVIEANTVIDPSSLFGKIHIYKTIVQGGMPVKIESAFENFDFLSKGTKIIIRPKTPLDGDSTYIVQIDRGVQDLSGNSVTPDRVGYLLYSDEKLPDEYNTTVKQTIQTLRPYFHQLLKVVGKSADDVAAIFSFKTQTIGEVAKNIVVKNYNKATLDINDTHLTSKQILAMNGQDVSMLQGNAKMYSGVLQNIPYYLGIPTAANPLAPLTTEMNLTNFTPQNEKNVTIPVLASIPKNCKMPQNGWPVVIFQHGITRNRLDLLAVAEDFASICYAAVAIDLPLHGITDKKNPFYMGQYERTFNVDYVTQDDECNITAKGPDGKPDCSGTWFINLQNPGVSRDNIRQYTSDLVALVNALKKSPLFDGDTIAYVGHSLGAMALFGYMANKSFSSAVLANPGGGIVGLLMDSPTFGPIIKQGLKENNITGEKLDKFTLIAQTLIDDADPINYAKTVSKKQKTLIFEVLDDKVIPNSSFTYPLSGTDPLVKTMQAKATPKEEGLVQLKTNVVYSKFAYGSHKSFLLPDYPDVTKEMRQQMASYILSQGNGVQVENVSVLE